MGMSNSLIEAGRLVVLGDRCLPVNDAYWLVHPPRSQEHRGPAGLRTWLLAEADDYCRHLPMQAHEATPED